ncbi:hypothetical protein Ddye_028191 [Dipteronia dyeriana]|uniref:Uncharacterized protein n=1 Tax=Dipteronia dyeriana TaxID=168575 RepID=A0AAD9WR68_9ROSI|nr:hypothetical protein Ddye_028191 [Dipteronia dyeriana]
MVRRSFTDIVVNNQKWSRKEAVKDKKDILTMEWSHQQFNQEWIKRCAVGVLKQLSYVSSVNNRLSARGLKFSSAYLGDQGILWCFETQSEGILRSRFFWDDCFSSVVNWSKALIPQSKTMWINIKDVPLCY